MTRPQYPYPAPPRPPAPNNAAKTVAIVAAALGGLCVTGLAIGAIGGIVSSDSASTSPSSTLAVAATPESPRMTTTAAARYDAPSADNLATELTVTEKQCFGSAGCNFKYELRVVVTQPVTFDPAKSYRVSIVIDGGTNWERIHSLDVRGTKADVVSGRVSSDTLATPVAVIESVTAKP
ncbi:hypothetical protein BOX37_08170 [Nocardia mangyaensis]|uniref:Uncharacterized protein n=1 Tax=Nocardia mangyaensis TaxID=2213200 RepID=A0A1J0VPI5_9NOCA|nr:hypothetical protein [Nocardia mangyaensis]APE33948.1 hypothetical protein BOX37_08170 [Nocardia mangyaensis]